MKKTHTEKDSMVLPFNSQALLAATVERSGIPKSQFARRADMDLSALNRYLDGTHDMTFGKAVRILEGNGYEVTCTVTLKKQPQPPQ